MTAQVNATLSNINLSHTSEIISSLTDGNYTSILAGNICCCSICLGEPFGTYSAETSISDDGEDNASNFEYELDSSFIDTSEVRHNASIRAMQDANDDVWSSRTLQTSGYFNFAQLIQFQSFTKGISVQTPQTTINGIKLAFLFDETFYLSQNQDVAAIVETGKLNSGFEHFIQFGIAEGRNPSILYDEEFYLASNGDVAQAVENGFWASGLEHFLATGHRESRDPSNLFSQANYLADNPDVLEAVVAGLQQSAFGHYITRGATENRLSALSLYNEAFYLSNNLDIKAAVVRGLLSSGFEHYVRFGQTEGRDTSALYDESAYLTNNPDVASAVSSGSISSGFEHYVRFGRSEGRKSIVVTDSSTTSFTYGAIAPLTFQPFNAEQVFSLSSNPGANHTIYLDFNGHITTGTPWNSGTADSIVTPRYDTDGDTSTFSNPELQNIWHIWQRVAEDFIPFDVNVTTALPQFGQLSKSGPGDKQWGIRVAIGGSHSDWFGSSAGGVAYLNSFNWSVDVPAFVFSNSFGSNEKHVAEAITHEVGHALGLKHDGKASQGYYGGHGTGTTGWAPIMGVGYSRALTQWSQGEYSGANNQEDDLDIITGQNGFGYRSDDYGDQLTNAAALAVNGSSAQAYGIIETNTDIDWFTFSSVTGKVSLRINAFERGANLDVLAKLYDSTGQLVLESNPTGSLSAKLTANLDPGQFYLSVTGTGKENLVSGYSDYGSLGQYSISGTVA